MLEPVESSHFIAISSVDATHVDNKVIKRRREVVVREVANEVVVTRHRPFQQWPRWHDCCVFVVLAFPHASHSGVVVHNPGAGGRCYRPTTREITCYQFMEGGGRASWRHKKN
jgi:ribosomal protein L36